MSRNPSAVTCGYLPAPIPATEEDRLAATRALRLLDTPPEDRFDQLIQLAVRIFDAPISYVALVDADRQRFKARHGLQVDQTSRQTSFCGHAILQEDALIVEDAAGDERFAGNPMVVGYPFLRFYAGQPISFRGHKVGTLCIADQTPRRFSRRDIESLRALAAMVEREFALCQRIEEQRKELDLQQQLTSVQSDLVRLCSQLQAEKRRTEDLLRNILPEPVAAELTANGSVRAVRYEEACVMFADFAGFTHVSSTCDPADLVRELNICYSRFDRIAARHGVEKLKTVGDCYLCVSGILGREGNAAADLLAVAFEIRDFIESRRAEREARGEPYWGVRIGLHSGPLVTGVVGLGKLAFDAWGDTVNVAARLEGASAPGRVNASAEFARRIPSRVARSEPRGPVAVKGKEPMEMFWLDLAE